jgi:2'-5' RNA ligase
VPHVTLVRPKRGTGPLPLAPIVLSKTPAVQVTEIHLVRSDLLPSGPRYQAIATARVG